MSHSTMTRVDDTYDEYAVSPDDDSDSITNDTGERWRLLIQRTKNAPWLPTTIVTTTSSMCWSTWSAMPHLDPSYYALCAERFQVETPC